MKRPTAGDSPGHAKAGRSGQMKLPLIGAQISSAGGFARVPDRAIALGAEVVQVFSSNPRTWNTPPLDSEELASFVTGLEEHRLPLFFHTIYLINLGSPDEQLWRRSVGALSHAMLTAALTGAAGVVTHVGSHRGEGFEQATERVVAAISEAATATRDSLAGEGQDSPLSPLLLENSAGSGHTLGGRVEELAALLDGLASRALPAELPVGLCLDTAHLFAAGYPVHEAAGLEGLIKDLCHRGLLPRVGLIHLNDSATALGSRHDRHQNPGEGLIGLKGLARWVRHPALAHIPFALEVPGADGRGPDGANVAVVKSMRAGAPTPPRGPARGA